MKTNVRCLLAMIFLWTDTTTFCGAQPAKTTPTHFPTVFHVAKATGPIKIDGLLDEKDWQQTEVRTFNFYYNNEKPTDQQLTKFRMLWDEQHLYVSFACEDNYITARETARDGRPFLDDCAEIFLIPVADSLHMHYAFEINLNKAIGDFIFFDNFYKKQSAALRSYNPEFDVEVFINGTVNDNSDVDKGWNMEIALPIKLFRGMDKFSPVKEGNKWAFLALRQERNEVEGNRRITSTLFPIRDFSKDVHQSNSFGHMVFVTQ